MKFSLLLYIDTFIPFLWICLTRQNEKKEEWFSKYSCDQWKIGFLWNPVKTFGESFIGNPTFTAGDAVHIGFQQEKEVKNSPLPSSLPTSSILILRNEYGWQKHKHLSPPFPPCLAICASSLFSALQCHVLKLHYSAAEYIADYLHERGIF